MSALAIRGLTVTYGAGFRAVDGADLSVDDGECVALVGESGCGKTTTMRAVLGALPGRAVARGTIRLHGADLDPAGRGRAGLARRIGYVTQDPHSAFDPLRSVRHHVTEPLRSHRLPVDADAVLRTLTGAGIPDAARRWRQYPHQWSGGMLQRADITAATLLDPAIILADEPTSALDAELADDMMRLLRACARSLLFVTHDLALAARHADRIVVMHAGRVVQQGSPREVLSKPSGEPTRRLVHAVRERAASPLPAGSAGTDRDGAGAEPVARMREVTREYAVRGGSLRAVDSVSLQVHAGDIIGIFGRSGSGKSTLLRLLAGLETPDAGTVWHRGGRGDGTGPSRGGVLPIFQDPAASLDARWPVWRLVTEPVLARSWRSGAAAGDRPGRVRPPDRRARREMARSALDAVGLREIPLDASPGALSLGQCQRVAIARVVCARPPLVVADEPTASLDVTTAGEIVTLLRQLAGDGTALVVVSHDVDLLRMLATRVLRMDAGRLHAE